MHFVICHLPFGVRVRVRLFVFIRCPLQSTVNSVSFWAIKIYGQLPYIWRKSNILARTINFDEPMGRNESHFPISNRTDI